MTEVISYTYTVNGTPTNAYSVTLASADSTFGMKEIDNGTVVVPNATAATNPSAGVYTYSATVNSGVSYRVSWKVQGQATETPTYVEQVVGPYQDVPIFNATPEFKGTFNQNTFGTLVLRVMNLNGSPADPDTINVTVQQNGAAVFTDIPEKIKSGFYVYEWMVPSSLAPGAYDVFWTYTVDGNTRNVYQQIQVAVQSTTAIGNNIVQYLVFRAAVESLIPTIQSIPIEHEQARISTDRKTYGFTFKRWNQSAGANIYRNNRIVTEGFTIDYLRGSVTFNTPNLKEDVVYADYNFRFYDDADLEQFIAAGINDFNICAPQTSYSVGNLPSSYMTGPLYRAAVLAIRSFRQRMVWPQNRVLFENEKFVDKMFEVCAEDAKGYAEDAEKNCERKKLFPYAGLTALVFQPAFTLPGGRARFFRYMFGGNS